jgi:hypothetical protein
LLQEQVPSAALPQAPLLQVELLRSRSDLLPGPDLLQSQALPSAPHPLLQDFLLLGSG